MHHGSCYDTKRKILCDPDTLSRIWQSQIVQLGNTYLSVGSAILRCLTSGDPNGATEERSASGYRENEMRNTFDFATGSIRNCEIGASPNNKERGLNSLIKRKPQAPRP